MIGCGREAIRATRAGVVRTAAGARIGETASENPTTMTTKSDKPVWPVKIIRSERRSKTVGARIENGVMVVRAPAHISDRELNRIIDQLRERMQTRNRRRPQTDETLEQRARELNRQYFDGRLKWQSIRYVSNQNQRFGSCTPDDGTIRLSDRLASMPAFVRDYVIVHELAHLVEANHGPRFWALVNRFPKTERARGYLMAVGLEDLSESEE